MAGDIHALEIEFAKNPTLDACIPLCEAYLGAKRFMEAMVVCKKGIKNAPNDPRGRVLLSRVYLEQGKLPKAEQELTTVLRANPGDAIASEAMGQILIQQGRGQEAVPFLQQAVTADPKLENARSMLQQLGVAPPQPQAVPAAAAPQAAPPALAQQAPRTAAQAAPPAMPQTPPVTPGTQPQLGGPWAGTDPAMVPPGLPNQAALGVQPPPEAPKLEHVSDFFADETLGFTDDGSHIETAGPGRLTILGFVPKSTGSIRNTIIVALAVFTVAFLIIAWQYISAKNTRRIAKLYQEVRQAMDEDKFARYEDALRTSQEILKIDKNHNKTLSAMAYAEAVLATDHAVEGAFERARHNLRRALESEDRETEFRVAAKALLALKAKTYDEGIAQARKVIEEKGATSALLEMELFRLMKAANPGSPETERQLRKTVAAVVNQARIYNKLGWYYYEQENWQKADQYFDQCQQNSRDHPSAMIGQSLTDLERGIALKERQKEIETQVKKVFSLPSDELSQPITAKAHFARAMLRQWQGKMPEAEADFSKAFQLHPDNSLFHHRRGVQQLKLRKCADAVTSLRKAAGLDPNNCAYYKRLGEAQTCAGQASDAKASYTRARQLCPKDMQLMLLEGERLFAAKQYDQAVEAYKKIRRDDGGVVYSRAQMGISQALRESGKKAQANKHMEKFFEDVPGTVQSDLQAELWCELGQTYEALKNKDQAMQAYIVAIEQYPYYADCHWYVCRLLKRGQEAKDACKRYLAAAPKGKYADKAQRIVDR